MSRKSIEEIKAGKILSVIFGFLIVVFEVCMAIYYVQNGISLLGGWHRHSPIFGAIIGIVMFIYGLIPDRSEISKQRVKKVKKIDNDKQKVHKYYFEENGDLHINDNAFIHNLISEVYTVNNVVQFNYNNQTILLSLNNEKDAIKLWKEIRRHSKK